MTTPFALWMKTATAAQQKTLAQASGSSRSYFYQLAKGTRTAGAMRAKHIEQGIRAMRETERGVDGLELPIVLRQDLCPACSCCEYMKMCGGSIGGVAPPDYAPTRQEPLEEPVIEAMVVSDSGVFVLPQEDDDDDTT